MSDVAPTLDELRVQVDGVVAGFVDGARSRLPRAGGLFDEISGLVEAGGKRIRPAFCYWGYRAGGGAHGPEIIRVAAALELLHTFAIVHDDIMDAADLRRGRPTVHARRGVGVALLVGDMCLVLADDLLIGSGIAHERLERAFRFYSRMRQEVIAGQYMELDLFAAHEVAEDEARSVARLKSGRYSVKEPLLIGASLASADPILLGALDRFGEALGEAFQLRDDLIGTFGEASAVGKPVDSDIRQGKPNVLFAKALAMLSGGDRDFLVSRWGGGTDLDAQEIDTMRTLIRDSGALEATEELLEDLARVAASELATAPLPAEARTGLSALSRAVTARVH